jgi:hypothetical protein
MPTQEHEPQDLLRGREKVKQLLVNKFSSQSSPVDLYYQISATTPQHELPEGHPLYSFYAKISEFKATSYLLQAVAHKWGDDERSQILREHFEPIDKVIEKIFCSLVYENLHAGGPRTSNEYRYTNPEEWEEGLNEIADHLEELEDITNNLTLDEDPATNQLLHVFLEELGVYDRMFSLIGGMDSMLETWKQGNVSELPSSGRKMCGFTTTDSLTVGAAISDKNSSVVAFAPPSKKR